MSNTERATCWSITINNPKDDDFPKADSLAPGWTYEGQIEEGEQGTTHYQGMLKTPQVRFSQVKKVFPRAHIEKATNPVALKKYVHKENTRLEERETVRSSIPTMWDYQDVIANMWDSTDYEEYRVQCLGIDETIREDDIALSYVDKLISLDIRNGRRGVEYIGVNPLWRSAWKKFWKDIIFRAQGIQDAPTQDQPNQRSRSATESTSEEGFKT